MQAEPWHPHPWTPFGSASPAKGPQRQSSTTEELKLLLLFKTNFIIDQREDGNTIPHTSEQTLF